MLIQRVQNHINKCQMLKEREAVLTGVSGGIDSMVLLYVLKALGYRPYVLHIEHGIRGKDSRSDAEFVRNICRMYSIPRRIIEVDAPTYADEKRISLEEAARELRYRQFEKMGKQLNIHKVAVAHHQNDQAETILFHLIRGSRMKGLSGMAPIRRLTEELSVIRPLLTCSRAEIEEFADEHRIRYCTDQTNFDTRYSRNRIRHNVIPELQKINTESSRHIAATAEWMGELKDYVKAQTAQLRSRCVQREQDAFRIRIEKLIKGEPLLQKELLYQLLCEAIGSRKDIENEHVLQLLDICTKQSGKEAVLPKGMVAKRQGETLRIGKKQETAVLPEEIQLETDKDTIWGKQVFRMAVLSFSGDLTEIQAKQYTKWFDYDKMKDKLSIRSRRSGDSFVCNASGDHKKIKSYLIDEKVPSEKRNQIPLIVCGNDVVWIVGYRISEAYKVTAQTRRILEIQVMEEIEK